MEHGDRLGAICYIDRAHKAIGFFGYGKYVGETLPSDNVIVGHVRVHSTGKTSATLMLDSGIMLYRCECALWAPEKDMGRYLNECLADGWRTTSVDLLAYREEGLKNFNNSLFRNLT